MLLLGIAWALFIGGMLTQGVITAPFSDRILKSGAVGYGWLNAGWAIGALPERDLYAGIDPRRRTSPRYRHFHGAAGAFVDLAAVPGRARARFVQHPASLTVGLALVVCVAVYCLMGCCRALGGVAITSTMMDLVPKAFHGTRAKHFLLPGNVAATGVLICRGHSFPHPGPGARVRDCRRHLFAGVPGRDVAGEETWWRRKAAQWRRGPERNGGVAARGAKGTCIRTNCCPWAAIA